MTRSWVHFTRGRFVRQARVGLGDLTEEHLSRQGFAGPVAMIYRTEGPNEVIRVEGDYRLRAIDSADVVSSDADDPRGDWQIMLSNPEVAVAISRRRQAMPYRYRDMVGDLLYFVHRGSGIFATEFGPIAYEPGDYVLLPKGTTFRDDALGTGTGIGQSCNSETRPEQLWFLGVLGLCARASGRAHSRLAPRGPAILDTRPG